MLKLREDRPATIDEHRALREEIRILRDEIKRLQSRPTIDRITWEMQRSFREDKIIIKDQHGGDLVIHDVRAEALSVLALFPNPTPAIDGQ